LTYDFRLVLKASGRISQIWRSAINILNTRTTQFRGEDMAMNESLALHRSERRLYMAIAIAFPVLVLIGFGRTYYLKFAFSNEPLRSSLVHVHGLLMTFWVGFFILQVWLIRAKNARLHMKLGMFGVALAVAIIGVGFFTAVAAAKFPGPSSPPDISPLSFMAVPLFDLLMFAILFGAAIYNRRRPANHKRLMLLTVLNFLPPALGRIPVPQLDALGPLFFFGVPAVLAIGLLAYETWQNRRVNTVFLAGAILLIASYPLRMALSTTEAWTSFATWLTGWAA
jgi:hypothetical protein